MASADLSEELLCSICLDIFTDPVTLKCGHNFCRVCIEQFLNTQMRSGVYFCPECLEKFWERPALKRNINLHNVAERLLSTQRPQEEITGICCTYCIHSPVPAVRSCLHCEASLCDNHLTVHSKGPEHVLTGPSANLENRKCPVHKKILEYYCIEDAACICVSCRLDGDHRGHRVEMLDEVSEKKKKKLRNVLQKLTKTKEKTEEKVQSLEERWRKAEEKAVGEVKRVTALFIDIRRRLDELEKRVLSDISRQEKEISLSSSTLIKQLEIKKDELSRKMRHIEELCNMRDPLTLLQDPDTGDLCDPEEEGGDEDTGRHDGGDEDTGGQDGGDEDTKGHDGGDEDTKGHDGGDEDTGGHDKTLDVDVDVITGMLHAGFSSIMTDLQTISPAKPKKKKRSRHRRVQTLLSHTQNLPLSDSIYLDTTIIIAKPEEAKGESPVEILLDINTAANNLLISDDLKTATRTLIIQNRPETAARFQEYQQVMSSSRFSSGRHCWDVEVSGSSWSWRVGMCYPSIDRSGCQSYIGCNSKSWGLCGGQMYNTYSMLHDSKMIQLRHRISSDRLRICLDYEAGQLSFYELCDPIRHLHTFTTTFTEPLHAALYVYDGSIKILSSSLEKSERNLPRDWEKNFVGGSFSL